tara:strand:+ start:1860 stop:2162 length:303 start_codon:yes stop_codon:yes gene_type:complete
MEKRKEIEKKIRKAALKRKATQKVTTTKSSIPKETVPRDILRKKLREKIEMKGMNRINNKQKEHILEEEMTKMGIDMKKFKDAIKTLSMEGKFEATLTNK